jgi:hypothetical protein
MNKSDLVELRYLSEAKSTMNIWDLPAIVDCSKASNKLHSITGILFFDQGYFGQILEGTRSAVEETWGRIQKDSRHHNIKFLGIAEIEERHFPKWSMKLFDAQEFSVTFPQFAELLAKIDNPDVKTFEVLQSLWQKV